MKNKIYRFKDLEEKDKEYIKHIYYSERSHKEKTDLISEKYKIVERTVRAWWQKLDLANLTYDLPLQIIKAQERALKEDTKVLLITTAQNKTAINEDFFNNLLIYKDYIENTLNKKTEIVVIPSSYRNPTSNIEDEKTKAKDWWDTKIDEYLFYGKVDFNDVLISASSRISPTAKEPLMGYEILASDKHLILGHSKIHFKTLPRFRNEPLRTMSTTGYITAKNYSSSKAGEQGNANHCYGFVVVEKRDDDRCFIPRNVKVKKDGSFCDLIYEVDSQVKIIEKSLGFVWGDIHARELNRDFFNVTKDWVRKLKSETSVLHDVFDGSTINPHEEKDMFIKRLKIAEGKHLLEDEIEECLKVIEEVKDCCSKVYISESNHDNFLDRHINSGNWKGDLHNSSGYLKYAYIQQTVDLRYYGNILGYLIDEKFKDDSVKYMKMGESFYLSDYQVASHGDYAANGSKGAARSFSRLNLKIIHAHQHSPVLHNNVSCVGTTCNIYQHYNRKGLSSWAYAHSVIHENGKNQLLVFTDDYKLTDLVL